MSTSSQQINLAGAVPEQAISLRDAKPDVRSAYNTTSASSGDIAGQIESASSNDQLLELGSGTYEMGAGVSLGGSVSGIVGAGSGSTTINCSASSYLFNVNSEDFVMEGVTFQADGDVALASVQIGNAGWFEDVIFRGQRDKYGAGGPRFTFLIQADSGATNFIHQCEFPDGGTNHPDQDTVGHAIGPNADPGHEGLNVWKECYCEGFMDNGFYIAYSPGRNVMWNCTAVNNGGANFRPGQNDVIVGGYSEASSLPDDRVSNALTFDSQGTVNVVGLEMYGTGDAVSSGAELIQVRADSGNINLDRTVARADGIGSNLARLDDVGVDITNSWWLQEGTGSTAVQIGKRGGAADVTADETWRLRSTDSAEISGPVTIAGSSYSGSTNAADAGLPDPRPLPTLHFDGVESGQGSEYGGSGGGSVGGTGGGGGGTTTDPQLIDGSDSPGSRWGLTQERSATIQGPQASVSTTVEPQWFNTGGIGGTGGTGGTGETGGTGASPGVSDGQVNLSYEYTTEVAASEGPAAIQSALDSASQGQGVRVTGSGSFEWGQTVEVPDGVGLDISLDATFTIPSSHSLSTYQGSNILTAATNANRTGAQDVTIKGGEFDFSNVTDETAYAGVWLHNATNSQIRDTVVRAAGQAVYGSSDIRSFGVCMTACSESGIYDSEGHDSGYDDIGLRGANTNCEAIGCSGSGGSSGTIQSAPWGKWDIGSGGGENMLFKDCTGERIYSHGTSNVVFDSCMATSRIQTLGAPESAVIRNSTGFEGTVLLYTIDHPQPQVTVNRMEWSASSDPALAIGTHGGEPIGQVDVTDCTSEAPTFLQINAYDNPGGIDTISVSGCTLSGSTIATKESGAEDPSTVEFVDCDFSGFDTGITGSYGTVIVENCTFSGMTESEAFGQASAQVQASGNSFN